MPAGGHLDNIIAKIKMATMSAAISAIATAKLRCMRRPHNDALIIPVMNGPA
jgi:hypothetical protein